MKKLTAVDLFAGCGGLTLGLKQAGFRVVGAIEIDAAAVQSYKANHRRVRVEQSDIRNISTTDFRRALKLRRYQLDLLAGCPPCQGFSALRTRNGRNRNRDKRNNLVQEMLRFAEAFRPKALMMENVPNLADRKPFNDLCDGLRKLGYQIQWKIKDAARYGVPQRRKRLILLAGRGFKIPFGIESDESVTVRQAISRLPRAGRGRDELHDLPEKRSEKVIRLIRDIPKDGGSRRDLPKRRQLKCHREFDGFADIYGRMRWDDVAPTITGGCFNPSKGRFLHPDQHRAITMREAAILQGFPRKYSFVGWTSKQDLALMIGNALPPEFIRRHALEIKKAIIQRE